MSESQNVTVFGDIADGFDALVAYDEKMLDNWVEAEGYSLGSMVVASTAKSLMTFSKGFVDVGRIGNGILVEGGAKGVGQDVLRALNLAGGGAAAIRRGTQLLRLVQVSSEMTCTWVAQTNAVRFAGQRFLLTVEELAKSAGVSLSRIAQTGSLVDEFNRMRAALWKLQIPTRFLWSGSGLSLADVLNLVKANPGGVVTFTVEFRSSAHTLYATWSRLGGLVVRDPMSRTVIYRSLADLTKVFGQGVSAHPAPVLFIPNALITNLAGTAETLGGIAGIGSLAVQMLPVIMVPAADDETATQALMVREAITSGARLVETAEDLRARARPPVRSGNAPLKGKYHTVVWGDWLSKLAQHYYGNMRKWPVIFAANRKIIGRNPDAIRPGQRLFVPNLPHARLTAASSLPPRLRMIA